MPRRTKTGLKRTGKKSAISECPHCHLRVIPSPEGVCPSCSKSMAEIPDVPASPTAPPSTKLWTPRQIAILSIFLGYPVGIVLSAVNWSRLKKTQKGIVNLIVGFGVLTIWIFTPGFISVGAGLLVLLALDLGFIYYLYRQMSADILEFRAEGGVVENAGWRGGFIVSLMVFVSIFICLLIVISIAIAP